MKTKDWNYFNRDFTEADITSTSMVIELTSSGMACAPVSFTFLFILKDIGELPLFKDALASLDDEDGASHEELTQVLPLVEFLDSDENQAMLLEAYNFEHEQKLPADFRFKFPSDAALLSMGVNSHNSMQF